MSATLKPAAWRYEICYGPEGETNYAFVYDADGALVSNLRLHHAQTIVERMNRRAESKPDLIFAVQRCLNFIEGAEAEAGEEFECGNIARKAIAAWNRRADGWQNPATAPKDETVIACQIPTEKNEVGQRPVVIPMYVNDQGVFCDITTWKPDVGITSGNWRVSHLPAGPAGEGA